MEIPQLNPCPRSSDPNQSAGPEVLSPFGGGQGRGQFQSLAPLLQPRLTNSE